MSIKNNKINDIFSNNDGGTLKFYHHLYTSVVIDQQFVSSSLNILNEPIWWLQVSIYVLSPNASHHSQHLSISYFSNIFLQKISYLRSIIINVPYLVMINGTIRWLTKYIFSISRITRKRSVCHQEVKKNNFEKILGWCFFTC